MSRKFKTVNYDESLQQTVTIEACLPANHLARFIVGIISLLDLSAIYAHYAPVGGEAIAPEILLGLLFYGYATGVFGSRKIEQATYDSIPFRFIAGGLHPDHDTIANFRKTFLAQIIGLFAQVLVVAHELGYVNLGNISLDGSKLRADASKHQAVSYGRLLELEQQLRAEVAELLALGEQADQNELPPGLNLETELTFARSGWSTWRRRKSSWKREPRNAMQQSKPSTKPKCASEKRKRKRQGARRAAALHSRPRLDRGRRINTTSRILTRGS